MGKRLFTYQNKEYTNFIDFVLHKQKALLETVPLSPLPNTIHTLLTPLINILATPEGSTFGKYKYNNTVSVLVLLDQPYIFHRNSTNRDELNRYAL